MKYALVDGEPAQSLAVDDRGLHYGDGLFETIAIRDERPRLLGWHLERLLRGCATLRIPAPDAGLLEREIGMAARAVGQGALKLIVTRGRGERGYRPPAEPQPTRLLLGYGPRTHPREWDTAGVRARLCATRLAHNRALAGLKHLNRLEQVLARAEWDDPRIAEGLMLDETGDVVGATSANVYAVLDGALVTPSVDLSGVEGVMRRAILELAPQTGIALVERRLAYVELERATELMLSNSLIGLWRVRELEERAFGADAVWLRLRGALVDRGILPPP